ncbi:MAG TPA: hypothetical protein VM261_37420 [Kofleriaceae bacterium]|nr:hypothetical protein [Kofleriaceae bacterium]
MRQLVLAVVVLGACSSDRIEVAPTSPASGDGGHAALVAAVNQLHTAGHTAAAFRVFGARVLELRPHMDETVAEEAELLATIEALPVVRDATTRGEPIDALALSVWPFALAPAIAAPIPGTPQPDRWIVWAPASGEDLRVYLERLCGSVLALECKDVVPEGHVGVVGALALERLTDRARRAVATCLTCSDEKWAKAVLGWEELERAATATVTSVRDANAPSRWPEAGTAAVAVPSASVLVRHVHVPPDQRVERVRYALDDARSDGAKAIALLARERAYPYRLRAYVIPTSVTRLPVRDGEPVQMLARALDARATTGAATGASAARRP